LNFALPFPGFWLWLLLAFFLCVDICLFAFTAFGFFLAFSGSWLFSPLWLLAFFCHYGFWLLFAFSALPSLAFGFGFFGLFLGFGFFGCLFTSYRLEPPTTDEGEVAVFLTRQDP
jgi:hypothetical protein